MCVCYFRHQVLLSQVYGLRLMILLAIRNVCSVAVSLIDSSILTPHSVSSAQKPFPNPSSFCSDVCSSNLV